MTFSYIKRNGFFLLLSLLNFRCKDNKASSDSFTDVKVVKADNPVSTIVSSSKDTLRSAHFFDSLKSERNKQTAELLETIKSVVILNIEKENSRIASTGEDLGEQCEKWQLSKSTIEKIFRSSKPISGPEWHYLYDVWPCDFNGTILINKDTFSFRLNAGSHLVIWNADTSLRYGCTDKKFEKYFLSKAWDPSKEE